MPKRDQLTIHLTPNQQLWVWASCLQEPFELSPNSDEPAECAEYRQDRERRALKGDVTALADLIRLDHRYLRTARFAETVRVLRSEAHFSKTKQERDHAQRLLKLLGAALGAGDLRGRRPVPRATDVALLYDLLLPVYRQAKRQQSAPHPRELPYELWAYFPSDRLVPEGITPLREHPPQGGKSVLNTPPTFTIPESDLAQLLDSRENPPDIALGRVMALLNMGRKKGEGETYDLSWVRHVIAEARREMRSGDAKTKVK